MCVIDLTTKADKGSKFPGQSKYVPWLVCMDSSGDDLSKCNEQVGVSSSDVNECLKNDAPGLLNQYITVDKPIHSTPTVKINGKAVKTSYTAIRDAICSAEPSLKGCSSAMPNGADWEPAKEHVPPSSENVMV